MIKHNELASRLNKRLYTDTVVNEEEDKMLPVIEEILPELQISQPILEQNTPMQISIIKYIEFVFNIMCFGFAAQFLLGAQWPILATLAIGYSINFIFNKILFLFSA